MLHTLWVQDIETKCGHKYLCTARCNLQNSQSRFGTNVLRSDSLLARVCREREKGPQNIHSIYIVLPNWKPVRTQVDRKDSVP